MYYRWARITPKKCTASKMCRIRFAAPIDIENTRRELESEVGELLRDALTQVLFCYVF